MSKLGKMQKLGGGSRDHMRNGDMTEGTFLKHVNFNDPNGNGAKIGNGK